MSMTRILFFTLVVPTLWFGVHVYIGRRLLERGLWRKATRQAGWATLLGLGRTLRTLTFAKPLM